MALDELMLLSIILLAVIALAHPAALSAEIAAAWETDAHGSSIVRVRNNFNASLDAFAIRVRYTREDSPVVTPTTLYVDPLIDALPGLALLERADPSRPLLPNQVYLWQPGMHVPSRPPRPGTKIGPAGRNGPIFDPAIEVAGILPEGATTGNPDLITRLLLRRSNMLLAVDTTLEILTDAGRRNVPRDQLIAQFKRLTDLVRRGYLPREQQIGLGLYQSIIGKLTNLPEGPLGTPYPPSDFVASETAFLQRHRLALLESQPTLPDTFLAQVPNSPTQPPVPR